MQIVFVVFTGEAWGYLGSRRFLHELDQHDHGVDGLDLGMLEMVPFLSKSLRTSCSITTTLNLLGKVMRWLRWFYILLYICFLSLGVVVDDNIIQLNAK